MAPRFSAALLVVVVATLASAVLGLEGHGVAVVGSIPGGLPEFGLPPITPGRSYGAVRDAVEAFTAESTSG